MYVMRRVTSNFLRRIRIPSHQFINSHGITTNYSVNSLSSKSRFSYSKHGYAEFKDSHPWTILAGPAAIILGINVNPVLALADTPNESGSGTESKEDNLIGLRKVEDGSVISNEHTSKWRIFTDNGREYFLQGKVDEAEKFFCSALEEAKKGFGNQDPHVASACNNLILLFFQAELYRVKKAFDKAEPLYLEAVKILEASYGPDDIRVGAAFHNLGQFNFVQRKLEEARQCYEIKRRVLGHGHTDYADTMFHLGTVLYLQGKEKDAEDLIQDSIQILEGAGQGESNLCIRRLRYLSQMYMKSNRLAEAENVQRKILHIMELSKGWDSMDTVIAAERLALTLQGAGSLKEARELLERCLETRKSKLPEDHIQIGANMLHIARVAMLNTSRVRGVSISETVAELDKAKDLLHNSTRIAQNVLYKLENQKGRRKKNMASEGSRREGNAALIILMQSLDSLGLLEIKKQELQKSTEEHQFTVGAENALLRCISAYKEVFTMFNSERPIFDSPEVKVEYLSCLKRLSSLYSENAVRNVILSGKVSLAEVNDEIKHVEGEISRSRKHK
ncbi:uncharacterized protein LOC126677527 isoform X3 [Mercurialis annua]|uniref:uncharacterized protein LOC126677527 isoform X3 n=1 Tax=Mercurialis annua TaxID=3986 RepID=UPI00215E4835|nr:uncharacterized protein LOC126677527 isoform X3 [Mercurialis annua]